MANLNKENIITVDVKNATVKTEGSMSFYVTDVKTCNIYCQLVINESKSTLVKNYAPIENAKDYSITLRLIKPNNEPKELEFSMLDETNAFFYVDLTDEYKDHAGTYKCELFVDCITKTEDKEGNVLKEELERITTSSFTYTVHKSIWSDLDGILNGGNPGQALIEKLATVVYVDDSIKAIPETDLLNDFAQVSYVNESINQYDNKIIKQDFASREYVNNMITGIRYDVEIANYATESHVNSEVSKLDTNIKKLLLNNYASMSYVDDAIANIDISGATGDWITKNYADSTYATITALQAEKNEREFLREHCQLRFSDQWGHIEWIMEDWAKIEYVNQKIAEAQLGGEGGTVDLSQYATKDYVHEYVSNNAGSGGGGDCNCDLSQYATKSYVDEAVANIDIPDTDLSDYATTEYVDGIIPVIDKAGTDEGILYEDFTVSGAYKLNGTMMINNTPANFNNELVFVIKTDLPLIKRLAIYRTASRGNKETMTDHIVINYNKDTGEISSVSYDKYAYESYVDDVINNLKGEFLPEYYASQTYVDLRIDSKLGDIESLLGEI